MFAKVYQYKFGTVAEAKVAASFCADNLGKKISRYKFQSLNVMIGKEGDLSIFIKFDTIDRLKKYETEYVWIDVLFFLILFIIVILYCFINCIIKNYNY